MNSLGIYIVLMVVLALLFVLVPIFRFRGVNKSLDNKVREQKNIDVFEQRLTELEQDLSDGIIVTDEEFEKLKAELQRGFLLDMNESALTVDNKVVTSNKLIPLLLTILIPISSFWIYQSIGASGELVIPELLSDIRSAETEEQQSLALGQLAVALEERFQRHSGDVQNGYMLGTLYLQLNQFDSAAKTFKRLADSMEDSPDKATVLGQLAQSQYLIADSTMTPEVRTTIEQTLALDSSEYAVMSLLAIEAFLNENFAEAVSYWRKQLLQAAAGSEEASVLQGRIARVETLIPEDQRVATEAVSGASLTLRIEVDESIQDQITDGMRLFVFARNTAMPAPLAAQNLSVAELPLTLTLDDSMSMIQGMNLSSATNVIVGARVSKSGQAIAQSGDFQAISEPFVLSEQEGVITLIIKDLVP